MAPTTTQSGVNTSEWKVSLMNRGRDMVEVTIHHPGLSAEFDEVMVDGKSFFSEEDVSRRVGEAEEAVEQRIKSSRSYYVLLEQRDAAREKVEELQEKIDQLTYERDRAHKRQYSLHNHRIQELQKQNDELLSKLNNREARMEKVRGLLLSLKVVDIPVLFRDEDGAVEILRVDDPVREEMGE